MTKPVLLYTFFLILFFPLIVEANDLQKLTKKEAEKLIEDKISQEIPDINQAGLRSPLKELTTDEIWQRLGIQIFKVIKGLRTDCTYLIKNKQISQLGYWWGRYGVISLCVSDLNQDNNPELLYTFSFFSGIQRNRLMIYMGESDPSQPIESNFSYTNEYLFLKKQDDKNIFVEVGKYIDYRKGTYVPLTTLGKVILEYKDGKPILTIKVNEKLPKKYKMNLWDNQGVLRFIKEERSSL